MKTRKSNPLADANVDLCFSLAKSAKKHYPRHIELGDLVGYAAVGLVDAAVKFDPSLGIDFRKYATQRIKGEIIAGVRDHLTDKYRQRKRCGVADPVSIFKPVKDDGGGGTLKLMPLADEREKTPAHAAEKADEWEKLLYFCPPTQRPLARRYFRDDETTTEIAAKDGCSASCVSLALKRCKEPLAEELRRRGVARKGERPRPFLAQACRPRRGDAA